MEKWRYRFIDRALLNVLRDQIKWYGQTRHCLVCFFFLYFFSFKFIRLLAWLHWIIPGGSWTFLKKILYAHYNNQNLLIQFPKSLAKNATGLLSSLYILFSSSSLLYWSQKRNKCFILSIAFVAAAAVGHRDIKMKKKKKK